MDILYSFFNNSTTLIYCEIDVKIDETLYFTLEYTTILFKVLFQTKRYNKYLYLIEIYSSRETLEFTSIHDTVASFSPNNKIIPILSIPILKTVFQRMVDVNPKILNFPLLTFDTVVAIFLSHTRQQYDHVVEKTIITQQQIDWFNDYNYDIKNCLHSNDTILLDHTPNPKHTNHKIIKINKSKVLGVNFKHYLTNTVTTNKYIKSLYFIFNVLLFKSKRSIYNITHRFYGSVDICCFKKFMFIIGLLLGDKPLDYVNVQIEDPNQIKLNSLVVGFLTNINTVHMINDTNYAFIKRTQWLFLSKVHCNIKHLKMMLYICNSIIENNKTKRQYNMRKRPIKN